MCDVLLLEPDSVLAKTYRLALEASKLKVVVCSDAESAIRTIDNSKPKVIVLELQLAQHNGVEFLYELRSYPDLEDVPVIVFSGRSEQETGLNESLQEQLGIAAYCYKPQTSIDQITVAVKQAIEQ